MNLKNQLRQTLRAQRAALPHNVLIDCSHRIVQTILKQPSYQTALHIAAYLPLLHEVDLTTLITEAWRDEKFIYLPKLNDQHGMDFYLYTANTPLLKNAYGILEPNAHHSKKITPEELQLMLVPLLGFDLTGQRLGQGAGYYDRYLSYYQKSNMRPTVVGTAFECQKQLSLPSDPWDAPLDSVITDLACYEFNTVDRSDDTDSSNFTVAVLPDRKKRLL